MAKVKILIVDDHAFVRTGIRLLLAARADWVVVGEAKDGVEAIFKAKELNPDIVVMDISMPRMDGFEATRVIRRDLPDTWVVIVSQNDPQLGREHARKADAMAYVAKVDIPTELVPTLRRLAADRDARLRTPL
jgi:DNA-binding NarL/FixJ family response regulator